jgi:Uma2 family endonuclease
MATVPARQLTADIDYPDGDGKPMAETPRHRQNMTDLIETLEVWLADDPMAYVSGNMLLYYVRGDKRRHVSPDVFVARGVPKVRVPERRSYFAWVERKGPDVVIELTSASTREEDLDHKFALYQDTLKVREYFLFDPYEEYLEPQLQGYRLRKGRYARIRPIRGRLPSKVLNLHLEGAGEQLRLYDPKGRRRLPLPREARAQAEAARRQVEAENARLRRELAALRRRLAQGE